MQHASTSALKVMLGLSAAMLLTSCEDRTKVAAPNRDEKPVLTSDAPLLASVAKELAALSPIADAGDEAARDKAAEALKRSTVLRGAMGDVVHWGQRKEGSFDIDAHHVTQLDSMVWRSLYLSLFMFSGEHEVIESKGLSVLRMKGEFRGKLGAGAYPYPFWHKPKKWTQYNHSIYVDFVFEKGKINAAYRSPEMKEASEEAHTFDGKWEWTDKNGHAMPSVALYAYLLSPKNPHAKQLDETFRAFAMEARSQSCMECHEPDNKKNMSNLTILNYPNQALNSRHTLVELIEKDLMPPKSKEGPGGIQDQEKKKKFIELAKAFSETADKALEFEKTQQMSK
jgi:hypothetical protein